MPMRGTPRPIKLESLGLGPAIVFIKSPLSKSNLQPVLEKLAHKNLNSPFHEAVLQIIFSMGQSVNPPTSEYLSTADIFLCGNHCAEHRISSTGSGQQEAEQTTVHFFNVVDVAAKRKLYKDVRDLALTQLIKQ